MTRESPLDRISRAENDLARAVTLLSDMGPGASECPLLLQQAAESLKSLQREGQRDEGEFPALLPIVRRAQLRMRLVQHLLDSAACFYSGWVVAGVTSMSYFPGTEIEHETRRGALGIEA